MHHCNIVALSRIFVPDAAKESPEKSPTDLSYPVDPWSKIATDRDLSYIVIPDVDLHA
jgi:hypothetical protein